MLNSDCSVVAIGATWNSGNGRRSGHVQIFRLNSGSKNWAQEGSNINGESQNYNSGYSVLLNSEDTVVAIGAPYNDGNRDASGHLRIFELNSSKKWVQVGWDIDGESPSDESRWSWSYW